MRTIADIEYTKIARFEPRRTGRTYQMIMSLPPVAVYGGKLFVVGLDQNHANDLKRQIAEYRGQDFANRVVPISSKTIDYMRRGRDVMAFHFDHLALEYGRLNDIKIMYDMIDQQIGYFENDRTIRTSI